MFCDMSSIAPPAPITHRHRGVRPARPLRARQARAHRPRGEDLPPGTGHQRRRGFDPREGCYAAFLTPKGKMLGDLRILDAGDEILLDTERVALQELFNMIRRFSIGFDVELHKRTLESGLLSLLGPSPRPSRGGGAARRAGALQRRGRPWAGSTRGRSGPTSASTCCATQPMWTACARLSASRRCRRPWPNASGSSAGARATASTSTTP